MNELFLEEARETISNNKLLAKGDSILIGVSGGPDSTALTYLLAELRDEYSLTLRIAHVNYGLRKASDLDEKFVRKLGRRHGIPVHVKHVGTLKKVNARESTQMRARSERMSFFRALMHRHRMNRLALGHNQDDQAETLLMRLGTGTSPDGLAAMKVMDGKIIRPLLETRKEQIRLELEKRQLEYRVDLSNASPAYLRNRVRMDLIPLMDSIFHGNVVPRLAELAELQAMDRDYFQRSLNKSMKQVRRRSRKDPSNFLLSYPVEMIRRKPAAKRRRLLRGLIFLAHSVDGGTGLRIERAHIEMADDLCRSSEPNAVANLPDNLVLRRRYRRLQFIRGPLETSSFPKTWIRQNGETAPKGAGFALRCRRIPLAKIDFDYTQLGPDSVLLDREKVRGRLFVRPWLPGDAITPLGMKGKSKKLQDIFVDNRVARENRSTAPIICDREKVLWVAGLKVSEEARVTKSTRHCLFLELIRKP
jgi:tRNA(Ile)-lysidine synthase